MSAENLEKENLRFADLSVPDLYQDEKEKLENIIIDCWERKAEYPDDTATQEKWINTKKFLLKEYGIIVFDSKKGPKFKIQDRFVGHINNENARTNVAHQIRVALKNIKDHKKCGMPDLAAYLDKNIKRGMKCVYRLDPDDPIDWVIIW